MPRVLAGALHLHREIGLRERDAAGTGNRRLFVGIVVRVVVDFPRQAAVEAARLRWKHRPALDRMSVHPVVVHQADVEANDDLRRAVSVTVLPDASVGRPSAEQSVLLEYYHMLMDLRHTSSACCIVARRRAPTTASSYSVLHGTTIRTRGHGVDAEQRAANSRLRDFGRRSNGRYILVCRPPYGARTPARRTHDA